MPFLITCNELFRDTAFPVAADRVSSRPLAQTDFHRHEFYEMLYVVRGSLINRLKTDEIILKSGDLLVIKPYVQHHLLESGMRKKHTVAYCCSFMPQVVDSGIHSLEELRISNSPNKYFFKPFFSLAEDNTSAVLFPISVARRKTATELFRRLGKGSEKHTDAHYAHTRCNFLSLLAFLADAYEQDWNSDTQVKKVITVPASRYNEGLQKTLNYIHSHIEQPLTLREMAAMCGVSVSYFCMLFKHATGTTFMNYLTGLRIEQACTLLRNTCDSISDTCYRVGFSDYSHFSRQFKKFTGLSPSEYRKQNRPARHIEMF